MDKPFITFDQKIVEFFNTNFGLGGEWPWGNLILCLIAILLSVILCGAIGFEREMRGRSAGLRTHLLVGIGSCLVMIISIYGFPAIFTYTKNASGEYETTRDVARLAAQVVAGVGFLGAGAIIHNDRSIKGLTTASTIWLVMAIGLCCGSMNFILAISGTLITIVILVVFRSIERWISRNNPMFVLLAPSDVPVMTTILTVANDHGCSVGETSNQIVKNGDDSVIEVTFRLSPENTKEFDVNKIVDELKEKTHAISIKILNHH